MSANGDRVSFRGDENVLGLDKGNSDTTLGILCEFYFNTKKRKRKTPQKQQHLPLRQLPERNELEPSRPMQRADSALAVPAAVSIVITRFEIFGKSFNSISAL